VDRQRKPGRFLLTGSANPLFIPQVSEALAGRVEVLTLWPLSQGEVGGSVERFIERSFSADFPVRSAVPGDRADLVRRVVTGGFPEVVARDTQDRRAWFGSYVTTILQRDVRELARVEALKDFPRLLALVGTRTAAPLNLADLSRSTGLALTTLRRYMALLEATFLVQTVPAWFANVGKRLAKAPKLLICDSGLAAYLGGFDEERLSSDPGLLGSLLETLVGCELLKQSTWSTVNVTLHHFRSQTGQEVDFVLEQPSRAVVGVEVKATASVGANDFRGLKAFAELTGKRFKCGVVLYAGERVVPFGDKLLAVPVWTLWAE
jgi:predicted AAA+ superfamily ATPase